MSGTIDPHDQAGSALALWWLADQFCGACRTFHKLRGVQLAAGVVGGVPLDAPVLQPLLAELLPDGAEVLIGGIADPGQVAILLDAAGGRALHITALDLCETPLELCRQLDLPPNASLETRRLDLEALEDEAAYDLVLSHNLLPFLDAAARTRVLERLHRSLKPGGRLVVVLRTGPVLAAAEAPHLRDAWLARARRLIAEAALPLPGPPGELDALLEQLAAERLEHAPWTADPDEVERGLREAGLMVERRLPSRLGPAMPMPGGAHVRQSWIFVCR